ncbi:receptor-like protein 14, partial [Camellia sinensis]|uniref:receptor-like protein 14 n=1 Tax=Camellia sinensis TaxID=4442 RepID=UPI0010369D15
MQGFEKLSVLRKLETLNLEHNKFNNSLLPSLSALTFLKTLNLGGNKFEGLFPAHELAYLGNVETLDLSSNLISGIQGCETLSRLKKLETLSLSDNYFNKSVILCLSPLISLKNLFLGYANLGDSFPARGMSIFNITPKNNICYPSLSYYSLTMQDSELLSKWSKMRHLDLSRNSFGKDILRILGALPLLKFLSLHDNAMEGPLSNKELTYNVSNLEVLILSWNQLNGTLPIEGKKFFILSYIVNLFSNGSQFIVFIIIFLILRSFLSSVIFVSSFGIIYLLLYVLAGLASFYHLKILDLQQNGFYGSVPPFIGASSLKALYLNSNKFNGSLPIQGKNLPFCELKKLEELDLSYNHIEGILPPCLSNLTSLRLFDVSGNQFIGNHLSSLLGSLNSLEYIDLRHNRFEGLFSFSSFVNHSKLEVVAITSDNDKFEVETEYKDWLPMFQLKVFVLPNCNLNKRSGDFPKFLLHQNTLSFIDLSHNNLEGSFPNWLLVNNTKLEYLSLRNNSFVGEFHLSPYYNSYTCWMDVSDNQLIGHIQLNMGEMVPYLIHINLSRNAFGGSIPSSIGKMRILEVLDLSSNNLSGEVPKQLVRNCRSLRSLALSNNKFHGQMFSDDFKLTQIEYLRLNDNQFTGPLTNVVFNLSKLSMLDISNNNMSGKILDSMNNMIRLRTLIMRNNAFNGQFPCALIPNVFMDISHNSFSGTLTSCSNPNLGVVVHVHLQGNHFTKFIPEALTNLSKLVTLDVSDNNLSGRIPLSIRLLANLSILILRGNQLGGSIPTQLCQLNKISLMDLSKNSFTGSIPSCLSNITFGAIGATDLAFAQTPLEFYSTRHIFYVYENVLLPHLDMVFEIGGPDGTYDKVDEVEFITKSRTNSYRAGSILNFMSGLDLSCNKLTGEIPFELGKLSSVRALNLSHN